MRLCVSVCVCVCDRRSRVGACVCCVSHVLQLKQHLRHGHLLSSLECVNCAAFVLTLCTRCVLVFHSALEHKQLQKRIKMNECNLHVYVATVCAHTHTNMSTENTECVM